MTGYFNNISLIALFWKWRKHILIATFAAGIAATIFSSSFFIKPLFSSTAIVYPANLKAYSDESTTEQMLQFFESTEIRDSLIKRFDLYKHYDVDPAGDKAYYYVSLYYKEAVTIRKTLYESVEIKVLDENPETACSMVNAIMDIYNKKIKRVQHDNFREDYALCKRMVNYKIREVDSLNQLLKGMNTKNQLIDFNLQSAEMIKGYLRTVDGASKSNINTPEVLNLKKQLENHGTDFIILDSLFKQAITEFGKLKVLEDKAFKDFNRDFTYLNIITAPYVAQKKSYPIRWLIIISAMLVTMITSMIVVTIIENKKNISAAINSQPD